MFGFDHPALLVVAIVIAAPCAFPVARFFFDDFETFKSDFGLGRKWERELWLVGVVPCGAVSRSFVFLLVMAVVVLAFYGLLVRLFGQA